MFLSQHPCQAMAYESRGRRKRCRVIEHLLIDVPTTDESAKPKVLLVKVIFFASRAWRNVELPTVLRFQKEVFLRTSGSDEGPTRQSSNRWCSSRPSSSFGSLPMRSTSCLPAWTRSHGPWFCRQRYRCFGQLAESVSKKTWMMAPQTPIVTTVGAFRRW